MCALCWFRLRGLVVGKSTIAAEGAGLGLFTVLPRRTGENIVPYTGQQVQHKAEDHEAVVALIIKAGSAQRVGAYMATTGEDASICSYQSGSTVARYVNDARDRIANNTKLLTPNRLQKEVAKYQRNPKGWWITAARPIPAGSEVFFSYGVGYWSEDNPFHNGTWREFPEVLRRPKKSFSRVVDFQA